MSLPARQQRALDGIESVLQACEPRAIVGIPLILCFMVLVVLLAMNWPAAQACGPVAGLAGLRAATVAQARNCQSAPALRP